MYKMPTWKQIATQAVLLTIGLFVILPIWGIIRLAFDGSLNSRPTEFRVFPQRFSLIAFFQVLQHPYPSVDFNILLRNSMIVSFGAAILAVVLGASMAYAFARFRFPGRQPGLFILLLTAFLPPVSFMTPLYIILSLLNLRTSLLGLAIVYTAFAMPFCIWNMRSAFQAVPLEVEESAFLDGAGPLTAFTKITLPLALPSIAVAGLIAFLMAYSEFTIGWLFVENPKTVTLAMSIYNMVQGIGGPQPWAYLGSLTLIMSIPVVVIFMVLQRTLLERMMFGNIKD
jgi:arabinogalactan oligomer / maltooligosaccharide transport system permease protein